MILPSCVVTDLFLQLQNAFGNTKLDFEAYWKDSLPEQFHCFGSMSRFRLYISDFQIMVKLTPPITTKSVRVSHNILLEMNTSICSLTLFVYG